MGRADKTACSDILCEGDGTLRYNRGIKEERCVTICTDGQARWCPLRAPGVRPEEDDREDEQKEQLVRRPWSRHELPCQRIPGRPLDLTVGELWEEGWRKRA